MGSSWSVPPVIMPSTAVQVEALQAKLVPSRVRYSAVPAVAFLHNTMKGYDLQMPHMPADGDDWPHLHCRLVRCVIFSQPEHNRTALRHAGVPVINWNGPILKNLVH